MIEALVPPRIRSAIAWRIPALKGQIMRSGWEIRNRVDFSQKEEVKSISVVVVGRNDNYGGDFSGRLRTTLDWNLKHLPNPELIYVEWNQVTERESDCTWISERYPNSKCFVVPGSIHTSICTNPKMPMLEYHAKNLGIRRASHNWIMLINADVFLGIKECYCIRKLNPDTVYATNYINIGWKGEPITDNHLSDKSVVLSSHTTNAKLISVVGNFILTHRKNWLKSTGYDESLTDVRAGVDTNGVAQLLHHGFRPMVIGNHYHLDHGESMNKGQNPTHGRTSRIANNDNIPYLNPENWGLIDYPVNQIGQNIWKLCL